MGHDPLDRVICQRILRSAERNADDPGFGQPAHAAMNDPQQFLWDRFLVFFVKEGSGMFC